MIYYNELALQLPSFESIDENPENMLQIFPDPTSGFFVISSAMPEMPELIVSIPNAKGKTVLIKQCLGANTYTINLSQAASGNYFVKVETGGKIHVMKIVVQ